MNAKEAVIEFEYDGTLNIFVAEIKSLLNATKACRVDMHEPDNQEVSARIHGNHLDNAMGADPSHNCGEYTVELNTDGDITYHNLANLIALARIGGHLILESAKIEEKEETVTLTLGEIIKRFSCPEEIGVGSWCVNEGADPMSTKTITKTYALKVMSEYEFEQRKNKSS